MDKKQEHQSYQQSFSEVEHDLQQVTEQTELKQVLEHLYKDGNLLELTDLTKNEIGKFSVLYSYAVNFGFKELTTLIQNNLEMRVSQNRKGRDESVRVANAQFEQNVRMLDYGDMMDRRQDKRSKRG